MITMKKNRSDYRSFGPPGNTKYLNTLRRNQSASGIEQDRSSPVRLHEGLPINANV